MKRRKFVTASAALGMTVTAGCLGDDDHPDVDDDRTGAGTPAEGQAGGVFVNTTGEDADTLDPRLSTLAWTSSMHHYLFDTLLAIPPDGEGFVPHLAADLPDEPDDETLVFELKEGVQFHDGSELTAEDVVYTIEWQTDPENASPNQGDLEFIDEVEASGSHEVTIHMEFPYALSLNEFASNSTFIVPEDAAEEMGEEEFGDQPLGSGPYEFAEWVPGGHLELARFDDYFLVEPNLDGIRYDIIPEQEVQYVELATGGVHQSGIPETLLDEARDQADAGGFRVEILDTFNYRGALFNAHNEPFDDVRVREAMQYLVDYDELLDVTVGELGRPAIGFLPEGLLDAWDMPKEQWLDEYFPEQDHDRAWELISDAGYDDFDGTIEMSSLAGEHFKNMMIVFQNELEEFGWDTELSEVTTGEWLDHLSYGEVDATIYGWWGGHDPDGYHYFMLRDPKQDPDWTEPEDDPYVGNASAGYLYEAYRDDPDAIEELHQADAAIREARRLLDRDERRERYIESAEILQSYYPGIQVYNDATATGIRDSVQDYEPSVWASQDLTNEWNNAWIDE